MTLLNRLSLLALAGFAEPVFAHSVSARFGELYSGLLHPVTTLIHLLPWIALGLLAGMLDTAKSRTVLYSFPAAVAAGAFSANVLPELGWVQTVNLLSIVILGIFVVLSRELSLRVFATLTAILGLSHGFANNTTELDGGPLILYVIGLTLSAYLCVALSTALSHALVRRTNWGRIAVRAAGSWVLAIGLVFGGYTLLLPA